MVGCAYSSKSAPNEGGFGGVSLNWMMTRCNLKCKISETKRSKKAKNNSRMAFRIVARCIPNCLRSRGAFFSFANEATEKMSNPPTEWGRRRFCCAYLWWRRCAPWAERELI
ncbi:hypothetical protein TRVL_08690 [Trypanosoma vivax]|nr:hypothetical protein TRVL_08690 [Trypanosoma vivax]